MTRLRAELRAFAQGFWEIFNALEAVSLRWPPLRFRSNASAQARIQAVRAGTRKVGADD